MTTRKEATGRLPATEWTPLQLAYEEFFEAEEERVLQEYQLEVARARVAEARKRVAEARAVVAAEQDMTKRIDPDIKEEQ